MSDYTREKNSNMCLKHLLLRKPTLKFLIGFHIFTPFFVPKTTIGLDGIIKLDWPLLIWAQFVTITSSSIYNFCYFKLDLSSLFWTSCIIISLSFSYQLIFLLLCSLFVIVVSNQPIISTLCLVLPFFCMCKVQA
jgi:hypothetical protein